MMGRVQNSSLKGFEALRLIVRSSEKTKKKNNDVFVFVFG